MSEAHQSLEEILFELAVQKPTASERAAFLDHACRGNPSLRAALDELLESHFGAAGFLPRLGPGQRFTVAPTVAETAPGPAEAPTQMLGRYKLLEKIGEGGFGEVWMAEQREPVKRRVALKIIKLGMDSRQIVARFEAERQALAMMDHPNIAKIFDADVTETGRPYFVMELVRGIKITEYCDQHQLPTKERLDLFTKVCHAIQHAHQKGIIHRDIKPSNILVTVNDGVPVPKVIDFGIAKATQGELTDKTVFTQFQQFIGTPAYISPEQAAMSSLDIDTRADIYSLGVLLYELLVGQTPFDAKEMMQGGLDALRKTIREREPLKPSTRFKTMPAAELTTTAQRHRTDPAHLTHQLRGDLDWIVMKCLEKDRTRRYETANGLAMDIQRHLSCEPVLARPPSRFYEFQKTVRRHKVGFAATAAIILALAAGITLTAWQAVRATKARQDSEAVTKYLTAVFRSPDPARDGRNIKVVETLDKAVKSLDHDFASQPALRARLQLTLGTTFRDLGMPLEAIPLLEKARDYYVAVSGPKHPETLSAMNDLAGAYHGVGRQQEAIGLWEEVLPSRREVLGPYDPQTLKTMELLSYAYFNLGRQDEGIRLCEEELKLQRKVNGPEHLATLSAMNRLAFFYAKTGRLAEAIKLAETVVQTRREQLGPEHADTLLAKARLAEVYGYADRRDESYKLFREVLPLLRQKFGPEHPETVNPMTHLGRWCSNWAWAERGTNPAAVHALALEGESLLREALPVLESLTNAPPYHLACVRSRLGGAVSVAAFTDPTLTPALCEKKMAEAEALMELAQTDITGDNLGCQRDALERYIRLYEAWPKPEKAAEWKQKLAAFDLAHSLKKKPMP
jgi:eukaryotic-like serine/threonine-protein kinase